MKISRTIKINDTTELTLTTVLSSTELSDAYYEKRLNLIERTLHTNLMSVLKKARKISAE